MKNNAVISVGVALSMVSASAWAAPRDCAELAQLKAKAQDEVVRPYERTNAVACVSQSVDFSVGEIVRDRYTLVFACKAAGARVRLVTVKFQDSSIRPLACSQLSDLSMTSETQETDREF